MAKACADRLHRWRLGIPAALNDTGPTCYGPRGNIGKIDYIAGPEHLPVLKAGTAYRAGRRLQLITAGEIRDHVPVTIRVAHQRLLPSTPKTEEVNLDRQIRWDHGKIKRTLKDHTCRLDLLTKVEE